MRWAVAGVVGMVVGWAAVAMQSVQCKSSQFKTVSPKYRTA